MKNDHFCDWLEEIILGIMNFLVSIVEIVVLLVGLVATSPIWILMLVYWLIAEKKEGGKDD